ncbi:putative aminotransferase class I and II [Nitrosotalea sinensis]|jgi:histidinol-phosphate aminotransferase|uniref:Putative aminotransferase class I and II n=1 Tax=Nitrosotalea sinensis TaxID=1499975 RepID=A0A2H1EFC9_9ARCH|nr:histidinol-phosphate transaminase [Candidatus Nitrosotalea sinensis]SHO44195.1 putative aminotransferase class I and II [Candidatus Nitrosotalea sinensis]
MKKDWFVRELEGYSKLTGYKKPEKYTGAIKLDSNENYAVPKEFLESMMSKARERIDIREYPLGGTEKLVEEISKYLKMPKEMIGVGNGSDQIIDLFLSNFASKATKILTSDPTFGFFEERCKLYGISTIKIPFDKNMMLDLDKFLSNSKKADILYLDTPNNPTGFQFPRKDLEKLVREFKGLVIIDEAYVEFSDYSIVELTRKVNNLIVLRTLSKSFGLAGLRIGYFVANARIIDTFTRVIQYPYPLNTFAIEVGILSLKQSKYFEDVACLIKKERSRIISNLQQMKIFSVFDSKANFVLFATGGSGQRIYKALLEQGISIKNLGKIGKYDGCLRVTVGSEEMNSRFLTAIRDLLN